MSVLLTRGTRLSQPQGRVEIDWGNPIARGLSFAVLPPTGPKNLAAGGKVAASIGSAGWPSTAYGPLSQGRISRNPGNTHALWNGQELGGGPEYTVLVYCRHDTNRGSLQNPLDADNASSARVFQFRLNGSSAPEIIAFNTSGSTFTAASSVALGATEDVMIAGRVQGGVASVWSHGIKRASTTVTGTARGLGTVSGSVLVVGGFAGLSAQRMESAIYSGFYFNRALSDAEIASISANPWQLFKPVQRRVWFDGGAAAGGASQTIAFTLDDLTASVSQALSHSQSAAFTLDGISSTVNQAATHSQSLSATLDDVTASISQTASPAKSQSVSFVLEGISASITQVVGSGNFQNISFTLDGISSSVSQTLVHSQTSSFSLEDVSVSVSQTARHGQALAISLEDVSIGIAQSVATSTQQTLSVTLDGVSIAINQAAPSSPLTDAEMRDMYDKVLLIYANMLTVPKFLALK